jgi:hypothetical protein
MSVGSRGIKVTPGVVQITALSPRLAALVILTVIMNTYCHHGLVAETGRQGQGTHNCSSNESATIRNESCYLRRTVNDMATLDDHLSRQMSFISCEKNMAYR